jgi:hypothetical protein
MHEHRRTTVVALAIAAGLLVGLAAETWVAGLVAMLAVGGIGFTLLQASSRRSTSHGDQASRPTG